MFWQPSVVDRGLLHGGLVRFVMKPAEPLGRDHRGVVVHSVNGVVDDPAVSTVEIIIILVVFVSIFVFSNKSPGLKSLTRESVMIRRKQTFKSSVL